ncbi:hypothetical protein P9D28_14605 [Bacillus haynesii]|uniref:hypothetical protein n=1 Tax=Bacillus haynesii TaxID=1925021 RepID=UPI0022819E85|nr:hypothetical protein [Bacillus haynesii]MCY8665513.1 hypothetical protein [Bacillus haynesii]MEC1553666.1 hypothetical protein [Bacillus haynesii]
MNLLILESRLLGKDIWRVVVVSIILSFINMLIYAKNGVVNPNISSSEVLITLFGSVQNYPMNWIYWIVFCVGYVILLQVIWKPRIHMFSVNQLLRHKNIKRFWGIKFLTGFIFTCFYAFCSMVLTFIFCLLAGTPIIFDPVWLLVYLCLIINLYLHSLLWLLVKLYSMAEMANFSILALFYVGVKLNYPISLLYFGMFSNLNNISVALLVEFAAAVFICMIIIKKAKKMDYL